MFSDWDVHPSSGHPYTSAGSLAQPCFFDVPLSSPSFLAEHFPDQSIAVNHYSDLSHPVKQASAGLKSDATIPIRQFSSNRMGSLDGSMAVDSIDNYDTLNPCQAKSDATTVEDILRRCGLSVSDGESTTPSLCSSDGSYSNLSELAASTPKRESPRSSISAASSKRLGASTGPTRTRGSLSGTSSSNRQCTAHKVSKPVPHNKVERSHPGASSDEEAIPPKPTKRAHSLVERRYRENLNSKFVDLHRALVSAEFSSPRSEEENAEPLEGKKEGESKGSKSDILANAISYIQHAEIEMRHISEEVWRLRDFIGTVGELVKGEEWSVLKEMVRLQSQPSDLMR